MAAYEPQHVQIRNMVLSNKVQLTLGTPLSTSLTERVRFDGGAFAQISPQWQTDAEWAGKGHEYPSSRWQTELDISLQMNLPLSNFLASWAISTVLGAVTTSGANPYTHVFKPQSSSRIAQAHTIYFEDTAGVKYTITDLAGVEVTLSGGATGGLSVNVSLRGTGKYTDGAIGSLPAFTARPILLASDTQVLIGAQTAAASIADRIKQWQVTISRSIEVHRGPGGGMYGLQCNIEQQRAKLSMLLRAKDTEGAAEPRTLMLANTLREVQINTATSGTATLNIKFPGTYIRTQPTRDGNFVSWQIDATEEDVIKSGSNEIIEVTTIDDVTTWLTTAAA
jgi:hypothetical protein